MTRIEEIFTQIVGSSQRMNSTLKVSVAWKNTAADQRILFDGGRDAFVKRARVSDASHASVAGDVKSEFLQAWKNSRLPQIVGDWKKIEIYLLLVSESGNSSLTNARARRQWGLDVRRDGETQFNGISGEQTSAEHNRRVWGVRTAGNGRNHDRSVFEGVSLPVVPGKASWRPQSVAGNFESSESNLKGVFGRKVR